MATKVPPPIVVQPSGKFDGNDGRWSSFTIRVGNPAQNMRVLVSTLVPETWVVYDVACNANSASNCADSHGGTFDPTASTTWNASVGAWGFGVEGSLGIQAKEGGNYSFDSLGIQTPSTSGIILDNQAISATADNNFWLGNLGINPKPPSFSPGLNASSFIGNLLNTTKIPSLSYSYHAGAYYRSQTNASLTLGGFDRSRFNDPGVYFPIANDPTRDLVVGVQNITYADSAGHKSILNTGILSLVDSTLPNIWLPQAACDTIASIFSLTFDSLTLMYTVNDTAHATNVKNNGSITLTLGGNIQGGSTVPVTLPYAALDLNFTNPSIQDANASRYFPIRVAADSSQYTLGRAFLQEAVLTVDYGRKNFTVAQALPITASTVANIVPILNTTSSGGSGSGPGGSGSPGSGPSGPGSPSSGSPADSSSGGGGGISGGAIGGIIVAVVAIAALLAAFLVWKRKQKQKKARAALDAEKPAQPETGGIPPKHAGAELHGEAPPSYTPVPRAGDYFSSKAVADPSAPPHRLNEAAGPAHELPSPSSARPAGAAAATASSLSFQRPSAAELAGVPRHEMHSPGSEASHELWSAAASPMPADGPAPALAPRIPSLPRRRISAASIPRDATHSPTPFAPSPEAEDERFRDGTYFEPGSPVSVIPPPPVDERPIPSSIIGQPAIAAAAAVPVQSHARARIVDHRAGASPPAVGVRAGRAGEGGGVGEGEAVGAGERGRRGFASPVAGIGGWIEDE